MTKQFLKQVSLMVLTVGLSVGMVTGAYAKKKTFSDGEYNDKNTYTYTYYDDDGERHEETRQYDYDRNYDKQETWTKSAKDEFDNQTKDAVGESKSQGDSLMPDQDEDAKEDNNKNRYSKYMKEAGKSMWIWSELGPQRRGDEVNNTHTYEDFTFDPANINNGVITLFEVFGIFEKNEYVRDRDTLACGEMGGGDVKSSGDSTGEECCKLWAEKGAETGEEIETYMGGALGGWDVYERKRLKNLGAEDQFRKYCCKLSDDRKKDDEQVFCRTSVDEKAACLKDEVNKKGNTLEAGMEACKIECEFKYYGTLQHNEDGKYDDKKIDNLVRTCSDAKTDWAPSTSVPSSSALAPVVPSDVKQILGGSHDE